MSQMINWSEISCMRTINAMVFGENDNDGGSKWIYTVTDIQRKRDPAFAVFA